LKKKIEINLNLHIKDIKQTTMTYTNRLELLPEELSQHIYKFVFNNSLDAIIKKEKKEYGKDMNIIITKNIIKKEGYWYDKIKENCNIVFFKMNRIKVAWDKTRELQFNLSYEYNMLNKNKNLLFDSVYCLPMSSFPLSSPLELQEKRIWCNLCRGISQKEAIANLIENGYVLYDKANKDLHINGKKNKSIKFYYKTWTNERMYKELQSF
jgi:hypothetical protein